MSTEPKPIVIGDFGENFDYFEPNTSRYLVRNSSGRWLPLTETNYKRKLKERGLRGKPEVEGGLSEVDHAILDVQDNRDISHYGPICGQNAGLIEVNGQRILVTEDMCLPRPEQGSWDLLECVLNGLFVEHEEDSIGVAQIETFHGWIKSSVEALRKAEIQQQQALAICGPPRCGKSFLQTVITHMLSGRGAKAERYFSGKTPFNADLYGAEHLMLEDEHCSTRIDQRLKLGAALKQHTVSTYLGSLHAKGRNAVNLPGWWRVSVTLNDCPEAMMVLPPLDQHIADKIILLRASIFDWPLSMESTADRITFHKRILGEIPAYLHWLIYEWDYSEEVKDNKRYNVKTFHHPVLEESLDSFSPEAELKDLLEATYRDRMVDVEETAADIEEAIRCHNATRAGKLFTFRNACGTYLGRLAQKHPDLITSKRDGKRRWWVIHPELFE